ncbi:LSU ribosomal protein L5P [Candidatus Ruthia magnifica str. Cm (Calyptogena magnifica)]|uniref:Large ribosomal subunit protein uL5 n=1 Tax=Ruthia magnifica subsp. Calyptogena magnifica TaxID=413404 RepID=RL5_RUTMC|nr:50S ribosomal protein L5 [Candidatus Ruthturnera calyptogenae]A1AVL2.1 RecName: Full=Large ribosomal subunit protein uL5; AltName: Full=50S ribosomal protein L5 [Candidatus Ruthia magnifica str. Cm (Calyptogena magnifica)]ABL01969.1 LSU ribosomal protein L5P [Candidatus Ruthia magnifica str. Cm (Calyptogena magnifica)]
MSRLQEQYKNEILPALQKELDMSNPMQVPKIEKITINMGLGSALGDKKVLQSALKEMSLISGQKPLICNARKSVASFKLREGNPIGCKVTLRKERMYEFLDRLINIAIPRIRDFRGFKATAFDGRGNYNMGITEQITFAEIDFEKVTRILGMDIAITTTAKSDEEAKKLLVMFKFPFKG